MADTEHKSVGVIDNCDLISEPVSKKPRSSVQNCALDIINGEQISSGDESGGSCAVRISPRPADAEPEMGVAQATNGAQENNNEPVTSELTNDLSKTDKILMAGVESKVLGRYRCIAINLHVFSCLSLPLC